jgi:hypothetical protein
VHWSKSWTDRQALQRFAARNDPEQKAGAAMGAMTLDDNIKQAIVAELTRQSEAGE